MSTQTKLRGGSDSELTKLKAKWRELSEDTRSFWLELFVSTETQAAIRSQIATKLKIHLRFDKQLNQFRAWAAEQELRDLQSERMVENERRLTEQHPEWTLDQVRAEVLRQSYLETLATGNFKLGLAARKSDLTEQALKFDREKFQFDAVAACRKQLPALKAIESNKSLSEAEKTQMFMEKLFGTKPQ